jgi:hypothetical protein
MMKLRYIRRRIDYTGAELKSHWIRSEFGLEGDAIVAFRGGCDVQPEHMVDMEDLATGSKIYSEDMLHFIHESFRPDMENAVLRQRLLMALMKDRLVELTRSKSLVRSGDDIYDGARKLTVSIATVSPVSALVHAGINISSRNTPVRTAGLADYGIPHSSFASRVMRAFAREMEGAARASCKAKWVR